MFVSVQHTLNVAFIHWQWYEQIKVNDEIVNETYRLLKHQPRSDSP